MAQYKVPQNVEADDKLLGPFSFRQFVYLLIAAGGIALAVFLFQIFPLLAAIPLPVVFFFAILALPLKKDQPMETYLAAIVSFYTKPRLRRWMTGQRESTIQITAPKKVEAPRTRDISQEEAGHRLSFLANVIDSGGQSINQPMRDDLKAEADSVTDMFDTNNTFGLDKQLNQSTNQHHSEALKQMHAAIAETETSKKVEPHNIIDEEQKPDKTTVQTDTVETQPEPQTEPELTNLAIANHDLSVSTIQKEAARREEKRKNEVYVSLH